MWLLVLLILGMSIVVTKSLVLETVEIVCNNIYIIVLFWIVAILSFNIWYLVKVIFLLVHCLIDVVFEDEYL